MVSRWRILKAPIVAEPNNVIKMTNAICVLHNYSRETDAATYTPPGFIEFVDSSGNITSGSWRSETGQDTLRSLDSCSRNHTQAAFKVRDKFASYFNSSGGELPWQTDYVLHTR